MDNLAKRPPCALMTVSLINKSDSAAIRKLTEAGLEVVVVQDTDFEKALVILEKVRGETLKLKTDKQLLDYIEQSPNPRLKLVTDAWLKLTYGVGFRSAIEGTMDKYPNAGFEPINNKE